MLKFPSLIYFFDIFNFPVTTLCGEIDTFNQKMTVVIPFSKRQPNYIFFTHHRSKKSWKNISEKGFRNLWINFQGYFDLKHQKLLMEGWAKIQNFLKILKEALKCMFLNLPSMLLMPFQKKKKRVIQGLGLNSKFWNWIHCGVILDQNLREAPIWWGGQKLRFLRCYRVSH